MDVRADRRGLYSFSSTCVSDRLQGRIGKAGVGLFFASSIAHGIDWIPRDPAYAIEGVHPFGEVMIVLAVPVPFQTFVERVGRCSFVQFLADPEPPLVGCFPSCSLRPLIHPVRRSSSRCRPSILWT